MTTISRDFIDREQMAHSATRTVIRRVAYRIFPLVFLGYFFGFLDRTNLGFAALRMNSDLGLSSGIFGFAAGVFFLAYVLPQIPCNLLMERIGARKWLGCVLIAWGLIAAGASLVSGPVSLCVQRFLLGIAEAGWAPGVFLYLYYWFPASYRARSQLLFVVAVPVSMLIGGPISGLILHWFTGSGILSGWRWLFIIQGLPTVVLGIGWLAVAADKPDSAQWLSEHEKTILRLGRDSEDSVRSVDRSKNGLNPLRDPLILAMGLVSFLWNIGFYTFVIWTPLILKSVSGASSLVIGFITVAPAVAGAMAMVLWAIHSDRTTERVWHTAGGLLLAGVALAGIGWSPSTSASVLALVVASVGLYGYFGTYWSLLADCLDSRSAAVAFGLVGTIGNMGGFVGPYWVGITRQILGNFELAMLGVGALVICDALLVVSMRKAVQRRRCQLMVGG